MNSNNRTAATLYSLGTLCLRNISINTLHKEDDDDEDNNNNNNNDYDDNNSNNNITLRASLCTSGSGLLKQNYLGPAVE